VKVGLAQVDGKWPNLALMKLSAWHKARGDQVEWFSPLFGRYDLVYASKTFRFTPDSSYLPRDAILGGTGYDLVTSLPPKIESCFPDYSIYPEWDTAIGFTTRGCIRHCPFCVVPVKEGAIRVTGDIHSFWSGQKRIILLDNNLTAAPMDHFRLILNQLIESKAEVDINQGLDIRLLTEDHAALLAQVHPGKSGHIHFAWDNPADEIAVRRGIGILAKHLPLRRIIFYVLIGFNTTPEEDLCRVEILRLLGVDPFVMPYDKRDLYQRQFARWVNHKAIFKTVPWGDYRGARGVLT
jgi:hypothetical protein